MLFVVSSSSFALGWLGLLELFVETGLDSLTGVCVSFMVDCLVTHSPLDHTLDVSFAQASCLVMHSPLDHTLDVSFAHAARLVIHPSSVQILFGSFSHDFCSLAFFFASFSVCFSCCYYLSVRYP